MPLHITFSDFSVQTAPDEDHAAIIILLAHAEGVGVEEVWDENGESYGCDWDVTVSKLV